MIVEYTVENNICYIKLNDKDNRNVLSEALVKQLLDALETAEQDRVRVIILHGLDDVFCAGADKESLQTIAQGEFQVRDLVVSERLVFSNIPIICAIEGHAIGGGLIIAACSDIVIGSLEARYGAVFMNMGFTPGMGCTALLELLVGTPLAHEMMYTGKRFRGKDLQQLGVHFNRLISRQQVMSIAVDIAKQIAEKNPLSVEILKSALSTKKRQLLIQARTQEDLMHRISFNSPNTQSIINEFYHEAT